MFASWVWSQPPFLLGRHTFSLPSFFPITATTPDEMVVQCGALSFGQLFLMNHHRKRDSCAEPCCAVNACAAPIMIKSSDSPHSSFLAVFPALFTACGAGIKLLFGWQQIWDVRWWLWNVLLLFLGLLLMLQIELAPARYLKVYPSLGISVWMSASLVSAWLHIYSVGQIHSWELLRNCSFPWLLISSTGPFTGSVSIEDASVVSLGKRRELLIGLWKALEQMLYSQKPVMLLILHILEFAHCSFTLSGPNGS